MKLSILMPVAFAVALILERSAKMESFAQSDTKAKIAPSLGSMDSSAEFEALLEHLRKENSGDYEKVRPLAEKRLRGGPAILAHAIRRSGSETERQPARQSSGRERGDKDPAASQPLPARVERFSKIETLQVGEFAIDICRRDEIDGPYSATWPRACSLA